MKIKQDIPGIPWSKKARIGRNLSTEFQGIPVGNSDKNSREKLGTLRM